MRQFITASIFLVAILISANTIGAEKSSNMSMSPIDSVKWNLNSIYTDSNRISISGLKSFIQFNQQSGRVTGNGACNNFGGNFIISGDSLKLSKIFSTKMFCQQTQQIEDAFLNSLQKVNRYTVNKGEMDLYQDDLLLLSFTKSDK